MTTLVLDTYNTYDCVHSMDKLRLVFQGASLGLRRLSADSDASDSAQGQRRSLISSVYPHLPIYRSACDAVAFLLYCSPSRIRLPLTRPSPPHASVAHSPLPGCPPPALSPVSAPPPWNCWRVQQPSSMCRPWRPWPSARGSSSCSGLAASGTTTRKK